MISIIVPVYNTGRKLEDMLFCIQAQSYTDWELILVDDGSSDETSEICDQACCNDSRISCIHQENAGVSAARNRGMGIAKGEYITFLDADDWIDINYLEELFLACMNADIAVCDMVVEKAGKELQRFTLENCILTQKQGLDYLLTRKGISSGPVAKLFRKNIVKEVKFPSLCYYEDILFIRDVFCFADRIAITNKTSYHYIVNEEGAMSGVMSKGLEDVIFATDNLLDFLKKHKELSSECCYITISHLMQYALNAIEYPTDEGRKFISTVKNIFRKHLKEIIKCKSFPVKEKIVYALFSIGVLYNNRKLKKI